VVELTAWLLNVTAMLRKNGDPALTLRYAPSNAWRGPYCQHYPTFNERN